MQTKSKTGLQSVPK